MTKEEINVYSIMLKDNLIIIKKGLKEAEETLCKKPYCDGDCSIQKAKIALEQIETESNNVERLAKIEVLNGLGSFIGMITDPEIAGTQDDDYYLACKHFKHEIDNQIKNLKAGQ